ncbi:hypothetical protein DID88_007545 [Monilinia fructigena]|uniref:Uncharacterized protein n=1 Tax=Monilinia fructigena TaxID=38457 RepID=A0A395J2R4_9HELO|nr:hypothetical protein DID88_007545 [Monilinia fructigena]
MLLSRLTQSALPKQSKSQKLIRQLHDIGPPKLTQSAACKGRTLSIEDVTNTTERRDVTPVSDEQVKEARKSTHKCGGDNTKFLSFSPIYSRNQRHPLRKYCFLDADNFPIVDPVEWMEAKVFKDTGCVLWPDFWWATTSPHYFQVLNLPTPSLLSLGTTESGQIIISKRTHSDVLLLVLYYNIFGPSFYYPLLTQCDAGEGDKETWLYAAIALEKSYYQVRQKNGIIGHHTNEGFKSASMMQHNPQADYSTYLQEEREEKEHPVFRKK